MKPLLNCLKDGLLTLGLGLLLLLGVLLFAVLVRPLILFAIAAVLGVSVLSVFSPRMRAWLESPV